MGRDVFCASSRMSGVPSGWGRIIANDDPQFTPGDAMRRLARLAGFVLAITISLPALADKATTAFKCGGGVISVAHLRVLTPKVPCDIVAGLKLNRSDSHGRAAEDGL